MVAFDRPLRTWCRGTLILVLTATACSDGGGSLLPESEPEAGVSQTAASDAESTVELSGSDAVLIDEWVVSDYMAADGSFRAVLPDTSFTFAFAPDGTVTGSTGCQAYTATFLISGAYEEPGNTPGADDDGQIIAMGNFALAESATCSGDLQTQIDDIVAALDRANRWVFTEPSFLLRDARGTNVLLASRAP